MHLVLTKKVDAPAGDAPAGDPVTPRPISSSLETLEEANDGSSNHSQENLEEANDGSSNHSQTVDGPSHNASFVLGKMVKAITEVKNRGLSFRASKFYQGADFEQHRRALEESKGIVAILLSGEPPDPWPARLEVIAEATLTYFGSFRRLFLCSLWLDEVKAENMVPCLQLAELNWFCRHIFKNHMPDEGPFIWPVLEAEVAKALAITQIYSSQGKFREQPPPWWERVLIGLRIYLPSDIHSFISFLDDDIGPATAYVFARTNWFTQKLWMLSVWAIIAVCIDVNPSKVNKGMSRRIAWEAFKAGICIWGLFVAVTGRSRSAIRRRSTAKDTSTGFMFLNEVSEDGVSFRGREQPKWLKTIFLAAPSIILFISFVSVVLFLATQLLLHIIYVWGDCLQLGCYDPSIKHGTHLGLLAEVGVDVMVAILFELFFAISHALAEWVAGLQGFESMLQYKFTVEMISLVLAGIERIGTFAILAFFFTPQWQEPSPLLDATRDCSDLLFKESSMFCFGRRLPLKDRRQVFQKIFKGPFVMAPFISIVVKVIVPSVTMWLDRVARRYTPCCCQAGECCLNGLVRILALIFTRDGRSVGCFKYVLKGFPFQQIRLVKPVDTSTPGTSQAKLPELRAADLAIPAQTMGQATDGAGEKEGCERVQKQKLHVRWALRQITRKEFSPMTELLEIKMSFLWIMFFGPIMPIGIIPTLIARTLEGRTDLAKMCFLRCRVFPESEQLLHYTQTTFNRAVACAAIGWSAGLSLITYNDNLYKNTTMGSVILASMVLWIGVSFSLMLRRFGNLE